MGDQYYFEIEYIEGELRCFQRFENAVEAEDWANKRFGKNLICFYWDEKVKATLKRISGLIPYERFTSCAL